jgi:hypothetical protein
MESLEGFIGMSTIRFLLFGEKPVRLADVLLLFGNPSAMLAIELRLAYEFEHIFLCIIGFFPTTDSDFFFTHD